MSIPRSVSALQTFISNLVNLTYGTLLYRTKRIVEVCDLAGWEYGWEYGLKRQDTAAAAAAEAKHENEATQHARAWVASGYGLHHILVLLLRLLVYCLLISLFCQSPFDGIYLPIPHAHQGIRTQCYVKATLDHESRISKSPAMTRDRQDVSFNLSSIATYRVFVSHICQPGECSQ